MKINSLNQILPMKSIKTSVKAAAVAIPLMLTAESCSTMLFPPPPPPRHHYPVYPHPHHHHHHPPIFHWYGNTTPTEAKQDLQNIDIIGPETKELAALDKTEFVK